MLRRRKTQIANSSREDGSGCAGGGDGGQGGCKFEGVEAKEADGKLSRHLWGYRYVCA